MPIVRVGPGPKMREALVSGRRILSQASRANRVETMSSSSQVRLLISDTRDLASDSWELAAMNSASVRRLQVCSHPSRPSSAFTAWELSGRQDLRNGKPKV